MVVTDFDLGAGEEGLRPDYDVRGRISSNALCADQNWTCWAAGCFRGLSDGDTGWSL